MKQIALVLIACGSLLAATSCNKYVCPAYRGDDAKMEVPADEKAKETGGQRAE